MHQNTNNDSEKSTSEVPSIDWQRDLSSQDVDENSSSRSPTTENEFQRPDSGVGESVSHIGFFFFVFLFVISGIF
jgi:hypothetical protein